MQVKKLIFIHPWSEHYQNVAYAIRFFLKHSIKIEYCNWFTIICTRYWKLTRTVLLDRLLLTVESIFVVLCQSNLHAASHHANVSIAAVPKIQLENDQLKGANIEILTKSLGINLWFDDILQNQPISFTSRRGASRLNARLPRRTFGIVLANIDSSCWNWKLSIF